MRIVAFITEAAPVQRILSHIGEPAEPPQIAPACGPPAWEDLPVDAVPDWETLAHPSPEYVFDQEPQWWPPSIPFRCQHPPATRPSLHPGPGQPRRQPAQPLARPSQAATSSPSLSVGRPRHFPPAPLRWYVAMVASYPCGRISYPSIPDPSRPQDGSPVHDQERVNWRYHRSRKGKSGAMSWEARNRIYDANQKGYGNGGHDFGDAFEPEERLALLDCLTTL